MRIGNNHPKMSSKTKRPTNNRRAMATGNHETNMLFMAAFDGAAWLRYMRRYGLGRGE